MKAWFRVNILGPWLRKRRMALAQEILEEIEMYQWASSNRVPDKFSEFCTNKIKELKSELKDVLSKG